MLSALVSSLHLLALAVGIPAVYFRGRALRGTLDETAFRRLFVADNLWAAAAGLWVTTGLLRAFAGLEKGSAFYLGSALFWTKMALVVAIFALEVWPMVTFIRWRGARGRGGAPDTSAARRLYVINHVQLALAVLIVFVASLMVRGFGAR